MPVSAIKSLAVAGVAALVWSHDSSCTAQQIRRIPLATTLTLGSGGCNFYYGRGLVQAYAAINMLQQYGCGAAERLPLLDANGLNSGGTCVSYPILGPTAPPPPPTPAPTPQPTPYVERCNYGEQTLTLQTTSD